MDDPVCFKSKYVVVSGSDVNHVCRSSSGSLIALALGLYGVVLKREQKVNKLFSYLRVSPKISRKVDKLE